MYLQCTHTNAYNLYPEPQCQFFFPRYFRDISTIKFHAAYTTIKLFCTQIQDVSTHMIFSTLKSKLLCRYPLHAIPCLEAWKMSWKTGFPRPNTQLYRRKQEFLPGAADFLSTHLGVADYSMLEIERYVRYVYICIYVYNMVWSWTVISVIVYISCICIYIYKKMNM